MNKKKKVLGILFEIIIFILGVSGVLIQIGLFNNNLNLNTLNYYTILSNIACTVYMLLKVIYKLVNFKEEKEVFRRFRGSIIIGITITMLVYHFMLSGNFAMVKSASTSMQLANLFLHYFVPSMIIIDYLVFDKKGYFKKIDPILWLVLPLTYLAYALIVGHFKLFNFYNSNYPYYFIDVDKLGVGGVFINVFVLILIFTVIGYIVYFIDNKLKKGAK